MMEKCFQSNHANSICENCIKVCLLFAFLSYFEYMIEFKRSMNHYRILFKYLKQQQQ